MIVHADSEWQAIGIDYPAQRLERRVASHAQTHGEAAAVITPYLTLTWREVDRAADGLAAWLDSQGLKAGDALGWLARNGPEFPVLLTAARRLRIVLVGYNWRLSPRELADVFAAVTPKLTVADPAILDNFTPPSALLRTGNDFWAAAATSARIEYSDPKPEDPCSIIFTSGTSGTPKPVVYEHEAFERRVCAPVALPFTAQSRLMIIAPQFHSAGWIWTCYGLCGGWPQVLLPSAEPAAMLGAVEDYAVTHAQWLPTMLHLALAEQHSRPRDLSTLEFISYGASAIAPQLLHDVMTEFACQFSQVYGLTEAMGPIGHLPPAAHRRDWGVAGPPTAFPDPGIDVRIVDEDGNVLPRDTPGLIEARMDVTAPHYLRDGRPIPIADGDGWIETNDLGRLDKEGFLRVIGRKGDMIITGGENVYPLEVENMIAELPEIDQVGVFGLPDPLWGQRIAAAIVLKRNAVVSEEELIARCRAKIASYKIPKTVIFVDALPRNATGKMIRSALPALTEASLA